MQDLQNLDEIIRRSLNSLFADLSLPTWRGREREIVSLFAFGHLLPLCSPGRVLFDPTQIGIEVSVPQLKAEAGPRLKSLVCKDVVIWARSKQTYWDPNNTDPIYPLSILEWKSINRTDSAARKNAKLKEFQSDVAWLQQTSGLVKDFVGYAILVDQSSEKTTLKCARISGGRVKDKWLVL